MEYSEFFDTRKNTFIKTYELILNNIESKKTAMSTTPVMSPDHAETVEPTTTPVEPTTTPVEPTTTPVEPVEPTKTYNIVELGTSRSFVSGRIENGVKYWEPNNPKKWDWGAGCFTKVFADNLKDYNVNIYSVDPCPRANRVVKTIIRNNKTVEVIQEYSTDFLNKIDFKIDMLYMDHMESSKQACAVHLYDSKLLIEKDLMSEKALILIDDTPADSGIRSKGLMSIPYLLDNGYTTVLHEYQILLSK